MTCEWKLTLRHSSDEATKNYNSNVIFFPKHLNRFLLHSRIFSCLKIDFKSI